MHYWLFKTEPDEYSIDDLESEPLGFTVWEGIRNYQARNILRDQVKKGDKVFIYHSSCKQVGVAGIGMVVSESYPDPFQFNPNSKYVDPKSSKDKPRWVCVDVAFESKLDRIVTLKEIKAHPKLIDMVLVKQGRLSVQAVTKAQWDGILNLSVG